MTQLAAIIFTVVIGLLALFQLALVFGAPLGRFAWGGQHDVLPPRLRRGSAIAVVLYVAFSVVVLAISGILVIPVLDSVGGLIGWMLVIYLSIGVVMNALSRSKPERFVMTPVTAGLVACALIVMVG